MRKSGYFSVGSFLCGIGECLIDAKNYGEAQLGRIHVIDEKGQEVLRYVRDDWNQLKNKVLEQV